MDKKNIFRRCLFVFLLVLGTMQAMDQPPDPRGAFLSLFGGLVPSVDNLVASLLPTTYCCVRCKNSFYSDEIAAQRAYLCKYCFAARGKED